MKPTLRGGTYFLRMRVPKRFEEVETRKHVWISLKTDSASEANNRAKRARQEMLNGWEAKLAGDFKLADHLFAEAKKEAQRLGFAYRPASEVVELPMAELSRRIRAASESPEAAKAALGLVDPPVVTVSAALELFWAVSTDKVINKTPDQLRRWKNPRKKVVAKFIEVIGDKPITEISTEDMLMFREHLINRVSDGEITMQSASKELTHFIGTIRAVNKMKRLGVDLPFSDLALKGGRQKKRQPFSRAWIQDKLLAPRALDGLNPQARNILLMMINSGARPSEVAGLKVEHLDLTGDIPMMSFVPDGRQLKNDHSERRVPLHGVSLDAARDALGAAKGDELFPAYFGRDKVSDTINKFLRENGLKESETTTLYSLRHSFEDRLIEAGVADRVRADLFGHALQRERYGEGGGDEMRYQAIKAVSF
jgi:integrase